jgi:hypothetical protein
VGIKTMERISPYFRGLNTDRVRKPDLEKLLGDFFDLVLLRNPIRQLTKPTRYRTYKDNQAFWEDSLKGSHFEEMEVHLEGFHLTEWLPSAPGRYFTQEAIKSRAEATEFFDSGLQEYNPYGKAGMVLGGIGSLRIGEKLIDNVPTHFLGASSSGISHQGIPVAMNTVQYRNTIEPIKTHGGCIANLTGSLRLLPTSLSIIQYNREVPKFCFFVKDLELLAPSSQNDLLTSVAIMFPSGNPTDYNEKNPLYHKDGYTTSMIKMWSFCSFNPSKRGDLTSAVNWLKDYAARHSRLVNPPILSNFDEQYQHFENPIEFSISKLFQQEVDLGRLNYYKDYYGLTINIRELNMDNKEDRSIHIGGSVSDSVINPGEIKNANIYIAKRDVNVSTTRTISIDKIYLEKMPKEYSESLKKFTDDLNQDLEKADVQPKDVEQLQASATEVAKETVDIKPREDVSFEKKNKIGNTLIGLARSLVKASPSIAEKVASMTPLAPFSKLIGESFGKIVNSLLKEKKSD